ncbi:MAG: hypothetical protein DRN27_08605 [Thermoplasmata archaeon]|nr:MAG: hypothetical protein DRN27_08605 [Thermoplasmata archaeon]
MNLLFDLSKEHPTIPKKEIIVTIKSYQISFNIIYQDDNVFIIEIESNDQILPLLSSRLAFTHSISEFLFSSSINQEEIMMLAKSNPCIEEGTIAIRYKNRSQIQDSKIIVQNLASIYTKNKLVDLNEPDVEIYVIITDKKIYVGRLIISIDRKQYEKRKVKFRPFFSPISLHPKLARALVNLTHVTSESSVLDPFCGTGGFLIEAGLIGCNLYGSDIQSEMIDGTIKNLESFNIKFNDIFISDIGELNRYLEKKVDAVITDAPYGKSTTTKNESLQSLYLRAFESISSILTLNGYIAIGLPDKSYENLFKKYFQLKNIIILPVHRSLTRYFYIGVKKEP